MTSQSSSSSLKQEESERDRVKERSRSRSPSPKKSVIETRRAEQNRAAQRAFRQRKERYVKELEAKVNSMAEWPARMDHLELENDLLKRRINALEEENKSFKSAKLYTSLKFNNDENTDQTTPQPPPPQKAIGEKGKVLDDLVSILKTRHRPPIPSHPPN